MAASDGVLEENLGLEVLGDAFNVLIPAGTELPAEVRSVYTTASDNQSAVKIHTLAGESPVASENRSLGYFSVDGVLPAPRGVPQIAAEFAVDREGRLDVMATDRRTGGSERGLTVNLR